jgi:hypothetical protein
MSAIGSKHGRNGSPKLARLLLTSLCAMSLAGCASEIPSPGTTKILDDLPLVENSPKSPCWQQRQIAAQRSFLYTAKTGKEEVFAAPCDVDKKPKAVEPASSKTVS